MNQPDNQNPGAATVLVVDDDPGARLLVGSALEVAGFRVITAPDGKSAIAEFHAHPADCVVLDVVMPGMNGRQFIDEARKRRPTIKVLYTTAYAQNAVLHHGRLDPGVQLLSKPFNHADLASKIRRVLDADSAPSH